MTNKSIFVSVASIAVATIVAASLSGGPTEVAAQAAVPLDADDIAGVVTGPRGPEAGVWVM